MEDARWLDETCPPAYKVVKDEDGEMWWEYAGVDPWPAHSILRDLTVPTEY